MKSAYWLLTVASITPLGCFATSPVEPSLLRSHGHPLARYEFGLCKDAKVGEIVPSSGRRYSLHQGGRGLVLLELDDTETGVEIPVASSDNEIDRFLACGDVGFELILPRDRTKLGKRLIYDSFMTDPATGAVTEMAGSPVAVCDLLPAANGEAIPPEAVRARLAGIRQQP
jgi:hypothetical protein